MSYSDFIKAKQISTPQSGFEVNANELNEHLFDWQNDIVRWALRRGRAGVFPDTGLGKTIKQLVIAEQVVKHTDGNVLIVAPLAVSRQTLREAYKFSIDCPIAVCSSQEEVTSGISITNYEKLHKFDAASFVGVVLDEASILKSIAGKTRAKLLEMFAETPYRYCFTATPSPNDVMELGSYVEFLGLMSREEMLSMFFVHDGGETAKWRLKRHAEKEFYRWMSTWCVMIENPSDIGYDGSPFVLPPLRFHKHSVSCDPQPGCLFSLPDLTLSDQRSTRRETIESRVSLLSEIINSTDEPWSVWCQLNDESTAATEAINDSLEITGSQSDEEKERRLVAFGEGDALRIVTKSKIAGHGLNWQHCCKVGLLGIDHSYEMMYQLIRRHYRFGQKKPVDVHIVLSERDSGILDNINRKQLQHKSLLRGMVEAVSEQTRQEMTCLKREVISYIPSTEMELPSWLK